MLFTYSSIAASIIAAVSYACTDIGGGVTTCQVYEQMENVEDTC